MTTEFQLAPLLASVDFGALLISLFLHGLFIITPLLVLCIISYYLISLPARRRERARLFLHLMEGRLRDGRPMESSIVSLADARDRSLGMRFHLTAAYLEEGHRLAAALEKSRLLPKVITTMLSAGERIGDLKKVMPACRAQLQEGRSGMESANSYLIVIVAGGAPMLLFFMQFLRVMIMPKMREVFEGISEGADFPFWPNLMEQALRWGVWFEALMVIVLLIASAFYLCGPNAPQWMQRLARPFAGQIAWRIPWKRQRMQRNFAAILATLLDAGMPEAEALRIAGDCTVNSVFRHRVARATQRLGTGETLAQAVGSLDSRGEFRWRLENGAHGPGGFAKALQGWFEALDAQAYRQEQSAAHLLTTALVLVNGIIVGGACAGIFGSLTAMIERGVLW